MEDAMCSGRPLGFHDTDKLPDARGNNSPTSRTPNQRVEARKLCQGCPVIAKCAAYAVKTRMVGVVMAGVPLTLTKNTHTYAELRSIAGPEMEDAA